MVTIADPAIPGEVVHAYMTGLGGPRPISSTGSLHWVGLREHPAGLLVALALGNPHPAAVTFAGLAQRMIGMCQVDISITAHVSPGDNFLSCADEVPGQGIAGDLGILPIGMPQ